MTGIRADSIMSTISRQPGSAVKTTHIGSNDFLPPAASSKTNSLTNNNVSLSTSALEIATILQRKNSDSKTAAASFDAFLKDMHNRLLSEGKDYKLLEELPSTSDPGRIDLAKQAANYLLTYQYGSDPLYADASSNNPFASLDRKTLSSISFDDSGAFTPAERQVAFFELSTRDTQYTNKVFDLRPPISEDHGAQSKITSLLADANLASAMSAAELSWRGWPSSSDLIAQANALMGSSGIEVPQLPSYQNLKGLENSVLAAVTDDQGQSFWKNIPVKKLDSTALAVSLIDSIDSATFQESPSPTIKNTSSDSWVTLYAKIDRFRL